MIADQKDFITPHITDSHTLDYPCFDSGFVCEYELPHWNPIHIGRFALDISPTRHVVMLWIAALLCIGVIVQIRARRKHVRGELFRLFLALYLLFRFAVEFIKPTFKPYLGLSAIQLASALGAAFCFVSIHKLRAVESRTVAVPEPANAGS